MIIGDIEMFDIITEQWTIVEGVTLNVIQSCAVVEDEKIIIIGGSYVNSLNSFETSSTIKVFDTKTKELAMHKAVLPRPMCHHVAGLLVLPGLLQHEEEEETTSKGSI